MNKKWKLIGRGFAGWHAASEECRSSGGELLPYKFRDHPCMGYLAYAEEGCFVYDASHLEPTRDGDAFERWIISGPMADPKLPSGTISKAYTHDKDFGAFDLVAVDVWAAELIRRVPNVKYGFVRNGEVVWSR